MQTEQLIAIEIFCQRHDIETAFMDNLYECGLVEITIQDNGRFISEEQVADAEKFIRLHYDLDINIEGLEAVNHLLQRIRSLQDELTALRNRMRLYEE